MATFVALSNFRTANVGRIFGMCKRKRGKSYRLLKKHFGNENQKVNFIPIPEEDGSM
jgi:hypothetical protein